ncbi:hypothetical protein [Neobacillus kokaensis]|uniref:DUF4363 domain-containing protein n=1 Tax=Neobacillus kokaensis TaxID=2759023 RepID=A0ABQ3NC39_9BACI|nr:hypothetical protein [Neobacillus kokaensis]GHI01470.1 hypothetical protein AM1BK_50120 [Neobacillus kokaensis]
MRFQPHLKKNINFLLAMTGLLAAYFIGVSFWNNSDGGVTTYEEYLQAIKEPYELLYKNLQALPENPTAEEVYQIYDQFEEDLHHIKIAYNADRTVEENYNELLALPNTFRQDYKHSAYKYSTLIGQKSHVKMILDYIRK